MKKVLFILTLVLVVTACSTITQTSRTITTPSALLSATVADLEPSEERRSLKVDIPRGVYRGGLENSKNYAEYQLLEKIKKETGVSYDMLADAEYTVSMTRFLMYRNIDYIIVSGRPATFKNFHSLNDSVWCNPAFRFNYGVDVENTSKIK
ncbi:MAG: membrane lipoprotein lipid attachment site-containing protein [Bacteroidaceae bacterium]|nr:membrane lipoprotein lipid attachment site-containing protein [Bacteroidaceae bacterium]